ncbi:DNA repair protein RecO [candidate division WWE3 bacterium]|nr:DNA repair protein RecO [candidate division WWE3 bacterium]
MPYFAAECVVLKSVNYRDADKIYTLYTKNDGKISAMARGVRKISSRRGGNLDTFNHVAVNVSESARRFNVVTEAKVINSFKNLKRILSRAVYAYYVAELVHKFFEYQEQDSRVFNLLVSALGELDELDAYPIAVVNKFEVGLMRAAGYQMSLDKCALCGRVFSGDWLYPKFNAGVGGLICDGCSGGLPISKETAGVLSGVEAARAEFVGVDEEARLNANGLIKLYVRGILGGGLRTERVFGIS